MLVRILVDLHHAGRSYGRGELVEVPDATAERLVMLGLAAPAPQQNTPQRERQEGAAL